MLDCLNASPNLRIKFEEMLDESLSKGLVKGVSMTAEEIAMAENLNQAVEATFEEASDGENVE